MSNQEMLDRAQSGEIGLSFSGKMSREKVMARLLDAQKLVIAAAHAILSDEYKFRGDEIIGKRR